MREYSRNFDLVDARTLTAREATDIWHRCPERLRYYYVLTLPEALANEVMRLTAPSTDAATAAPDRRRDSARPVPPVNLGE